MVDAGVLWMVGLIVVAAVAGVVIYEAGRGRGARGTNEWWTSATGITSTELEQGVYSRQLTSLRWMIGRALPVPLSEDPWDPTCGVAVQSRSGKTRMWFGYGDSWELRLAPALDARLLRIGLEVTERGHHLMLMDGEGMEIAQLLVGMPEDGHVRVGLKSPFGEPLCEQDFCMSRLGWVETGAANE